MTLVQEELLELLKRIHALCLQNGIKYSVYAGTQLGAVREQGFIPWDYDADIIVKREEYKKLRNVMYGNSRDTTIILDDISDRIPKFVMHRKGKCAVFVDVFIYDPISQVPVCRQVKIYLSLLLAAITKTPETIKIIKVKKKLTGWKFKLFYLIYLLGRPFPMRMKIDFRSWFCERILTGNKTMIYCSNDIEECIRRNIHLTDTLQEYMEIPFEDTKLLTFKNYHEILLALYGEDYMIPKKYPKTEFDSHELNRLLLEKKWSRG